MIVGIILAYATVKFKARTAADEHAEPPPQGHGNPFIELGLIGASVFALVIIAVPTLRDIWYTYDVPAADKANAYRGDRHRLPMVVQVRLPQRADLRRGTLTTGNELVIPAGRPSTSTCAR